MKKEVSMQFIDLAAQQRRIRPDLERRIKAVLDHGSYIMGSEVRELEEGLAVFTGARHCISCASGTDALLMVLMAWDIGPGDAVFVPPFTFFATAEVVSLLGATPVMVDIDSVSFNMDPKALEKAIENLKAREASPRRNRFASGYPLPQTLIEKPCEGGTITWSLPDLTPRVVIPVDLFGQPAAYAEILPLAQKHGLLVMEDAAQSFGALYNGKRACALGCHAAAASFFPAKPLGCYGDGGAIFTDDDALAAVLQSIRVHGKGNDKYDNVRIGLNGRLDTLQAAILLAKLELFSEEIELRQKVAQAYTEELAAIPNITPPRIAEGNLSVWAQYCILVADGRRDAVVAHLKEKGIPTNIYYPTPMHMLAAFKNLGYAPDDMPVSLAMSRVILALPFHPYMAEAEVRAVSNALREALR